MEHTGPDSVTLMIEWVTDLRLRGLIAPRIALDNLVDDGRPVGRLHIGPGADALITEGGYLVFRPSARGGLGRLEVVDAERFHGEFQPA
ncbi:MAG TPA: hypothetical protein VGL06_15800 [Pseudonocardiaceae bacterium]|jgi:hypothetical protein